MAGMSRKREEVEALRFCAAKRGISERSVRTWRSASDPRWLADLAEWERKMGYEVRTGRSPREADPAEVPIGEPVDDGFGEGLAAEVMRTRRECKELALLWAQFKGGGRHTAAEQIGRQLDSRRDILRKLEADAARIGVELGDVVPKTLVTNYAADVASRAATLVRRLLTLLPADSAEEVKAGITREVESFQDSCTKIELRIA
jgi:hypothetical protein